LASGEVVTFVWLGANAIVVLFVAVRGWHALTVWQRRYAFIAIASAAAVEVLNYINPPDTALTSVLFWIVFPIYTVTVWWGIVIGAVLLFDLIVRRREQPE
jgi:hypothetical protein